jgi:hypothetical protein
MALAEVTSAYIAGKVPGWVIASTGFVQALLQKRRYLAYYSSMLSNAMDATASISLRRALRMPQLQMAIKATSSKARHNPLTGSTYEAFFPPRRRHVSMASPDCGLRDNEMHVPRRIERSGKGSSTTFDHHGMPKPDENSFGRLHDVSGRRKRMVKSLICPQHGTHYCLRQRLASSMVSPYGFVPKARGRQLRNMPGHKGEGGVTLYVKSNA